MECGKERAFHNAGRARPRLHEALGDCELDVCLRVETEPNVVREDISVNAIANNLVEVYTVHVITCMRVSFIMSL